MTLVENKKLHLTYTFTESYEAGMELFGFEVKTLRAKLGSLEGAKVIVRGGEAFIVGSYIPPYQPKNTPISYDPYRVRKILLHKQELFTLASLEASKGLTIAPHKLYVKNNLVKCEIVVCKRKDARDKREDIKKTISLREIRE